ncbi:MAG: carbohydrate kinase family protein [Lachnospirales bacterium]
MNNTGKVIVAGHACLDITPIFSSTTKSKISELFVPGTLIHMDSAEVNVGGSVSNTGLAMKFLGADVKLITKVGNDNFGETIASIYKAHGIKEGLVVDENSTTSYSVVLAPKGIDRIFLHHPGANDTFSNEDVLEEELEGVSLFHFGYPPLMKTMYENNGQELVSLFKRVKEKGLATSLDMAAVDENSESGKQDWKNILQNLLPYVDFFVPSVEELCFMLDPERLLEWKKRAKDKEITEVLDYKNNVEPLGNELLKMGCKVVLIKCGAPGLYYTVADENNLNTMGNGILKNTKNWASKNGFEKSYMPDLIVSATGAGDTTIAAFLTSILKGYSLEEALQLATATGALNVTSYDALSGLKSFDEIKEKINNGWKKSW